MPLKCRHLVLPSVAPPCRPPCDVPTRPAHCVSEFWTRQVLRTHFALLNKPRIPCLFSDPIPCLLLPVSLDNCVSLLHLAFFLLDYHFNRKIPIAIYLGQVLNSNARLQVSKHFSACNQRNEAQLLTFIAEKTSPWQLGMTGKGKMNCMQHKGVFICKKLRRAVDLENELCYFVCVSIMLGVVILSFSWQGLLKLSV